MPRFQTVIRRARFVYSPYTANEMQGFAPVLADTIRARIQSGQNIYDQAASPLKPGKTGAQGISGLQVRTRPGRRQTASQIAFYNNQRERQWGVSPRDRAALMALMLNYRPLVTLQEMQLGGAYFRGMRQFGFGQYINSLPKVA